MDTFSQWHAAPYLPCGTHSYLVPPDSSTLLVCHGPLWSVRCRTLMYINPPSQSLKPQLELLVQSSQLALISLSAKTQPPASSQPLVSALGRLCTLVPLSPCPCVFAPCPQGNWLNTSSSSSTHWPTQRRVGHTPSQHASQTSTTVHCSH